MNAIELKSPVFPLFQRGILVSASLTLFGKEGKGRFPQEIIQ
jgi:hypothetical protein